MGNKDINKRKVMGFIIMHFDLAEFVIEDWPLLPGGTLLKDKKGGSILVWSDIMSSSIYYSVNGEPAEKVAMPELED